VNVMLTIDMDKRCAECGKPGATGSGICLPCATKAMSGKPMRSPAGQVVQRRIMKRNAPAEARVLPSPPAGCSAWIAVRDRFPDDARDVLTFGRYGVHKACFEWGTEDDPCWWTDEVRKADFKESVTHWAELPNAESEDLT